MNNYEYFFIYNILWLAKMCLGLTLFRFRLKANHLVTIFLVAVPFALVSTYVQTLNKLYLISPVQLVLGLIFYTFLMRFKWYHGIIIVLMVDGLNMMLEVVLNLVITRFNIQTLLWILSGNDLLSVALLMILVQVLIIGLLLKFRLGFSFISVSPNLNILKMEYNQRVLPKIIICTMFVVINNVVLYFFNFAFLWINIILNISWVVLFWSAYLFEKRELMSE